MANFAMTDSNSMRALATVLSNGGKSDMTIEGKVDKLCEAEAWSLKYLADVAEHGFVTPPECRQSHEALRLEVKSAIQEAGASLTMASCIKHGGWAAVCIVAMIVLSKAMGWI
jgi:hypothetical protein